MKRRRLLALIAFSGLSLAMLTGCIRDDSRGWGAPIVVEDTQVVSTSRGKLDGIDLSRNASPAWTGVLSMPLSERDTRILSVTISPTGTPYQGDLLRIGSEIIRVRSLTINGAEREMHLDRGYAGTIAAPHAAGAEITAERRAWRFPDDWRIREGSARRLQGVYGAPTVDSTGVMYVGDYGGWVYAFEPQRVNLDAAGDSEKPETAVVDLGEHVFGGLALDEGAGRLYATSGDRLFMVSTERLKASLMAGGGRIEPEASFFFQAGEDLWAPPVLDDGTIYLTSLDGNLYALDSATGNVRWAYDSGRGLATKPVLLDDLILIAGFDNALMAVDRTTGGLAWRYDAANWIFATPVVEGDTAYFGDFDGVLHAVNARNGASEWSLGLDRGIIRAAVAVADDIVVVGTDAGWLIGVNHESRQIAWQVNIGSDILADLVAADDEVLIAPQGCITLPGGEVRTYYRAVDAATGTLRRAEGVC